MFNDLGIRVDLGTSWQGTSWHGYELTSTPTSFTYCPKIFMQLLLHVTVGLDFNILINGGQQRVCA